MTSSVLIFSNTSWYLYNFRANLIKHLIEAGSTVTALAPDNDYEDKLKGLGADFRQVKLSRLGINPVRELQSIFNIYRIVKIVSPDYFLTFTPKCNLYGGLTLMFNKNIVGIANISGQGRSSEQVKTSRLEKFIRFLNRLFLSNFRHVFFQNNEDMQGFIKSNIISVKKCSRLPGSGVDLKRFSARKSGMNSNSKTVFLLASRMLIDKGIPEFVDACKKLKKEGYDFTAKIVGPLDPANPRGVPSKDLYQWETDGIIEYIGFKNNMVPVFESADCFVLPSKYREGVPKSLLEAGAMSLPIITTDMPGCRDAVKDGISGYLCKPSSIDDLIDRMEKFLKLNHTQRRKMGRQGRKFVEANFNENLVLAAYFRTMKIKNVHTFDLGLQRIESDS